MPLRKLSTTDNDMTEDILQRLFHPGVGKEPYYRFQNADGKVWIMPAKHLRTAMELYQPSGKKGKLLKRWLPLLHKLSIVRKLIRAEQNTYRPDDELQRLLERVFHTSGLELALFCGTPCVHQKMTMQISKGGHILGYCKMTDCDEIATLFDREGRLLNTLHQKGMTNVPACLFCGQMMDGTWLFVQSTAKTCASRVVHDWGMEHDRFLKKLQAATVQHLKFEESDYYHTTRALEKHLQWIPAEVDGDVVRKAMNDVCRRWTGKEVDFSVCHADFTPWNMFVEKGELFVFDWEYSQHTYPPMMDQYHFFTQSALFERHWNAGDIRKYMASDAGEWMNTADYKAYLIEVLARFTIREKGHVGGDMARSMKLWSDLLVFLTSES